MGRCVWRAWITAILFAVLASTGFVHADNLPSAYILPNASAPNSYSPARFWTPTLARIHDYFHGPKISVYPPDRHPDLPPTFSNIRFPCPAADAASTLIERASPPPTSKFRY
jgi:hypothetical protein